MNMKMVYERGTIMNIIIADDEPLALEMTCGS